MRVRVLGPMEVWNGEEWRRLTAPKVRTLLAILMIHAGQPLTVERLVEELWPERPGRSAVNQLHGYVWRLRGLLGDQTGRLLRTASPGYELTLTPDDTDVGCFERLAHEGTTALRDGAADRAAALFDEALGLWRGEAFADITATDAVRLEADRLTERRLTVQELRIDAALAMGRHAEVVPELQELVAAEPYRERLRTQLMLALYRSGRQADALATYRDLYRILDEELGVEPGRMVTELHEQILRSDPALDAQTQAGGVAGPQPASDPSPPARPTTPVPRQLPADIADFTGREHELARLDSHLDDAAVGISIISGTGGVGKTTLAVHWAHRVAELFPDGQLYVNLRGYAQAPPVQPADVLPAFLRALGVTHDRISHNVDEVAALCRSTLADKRILVVLDNAATAQQVRPLLPGSRGCHVLVTSRDQLTGLVVHNGARRLDLRQLEPHESTALLGKIAGVERVESEPDASASVVRLCGHLPLAIRVVAAHLAADPYRSVSAQHAELECRDRLDALRVDGDVESSLMTSFDLSYDKLCEQEQNVFRLASLIPGPEFSAEAVSALTDLDVADASRLLGRLATGHLLERRDRGRFAFHDLIRLYAWRRCQREDDARRRDGAVTRLLRWYLATASEAVALILPDIYRLPVDIESAEPKPTFTDADTAMAWLEMEQPNLPLVVQLAARHAGEPPAWLFADVLRGFYFFTRHMADWLTVAQLGLSTARHARNVTGMAGAEVSLTQAYRCLNDYDAAQDHGTRALELCRDVGWLEGEAVTLNELAGIRFEQGGLQSGIDLLERAIAIDREIGNHELEAIHQMNVAMAYWHLGRLREAVAGLESLLANDFERSSPQRRALVLSNLAESYLWLGRFDDAQELLRQALAIHDEIRFPAGLAATHANLATLATERGDLDRARHHAETVGELAKNMGSRRMTGHSVTLLAQIARRRGQRARAVELAEQSVRILTEGATPLELIDGLLVMGNAYLDAGDVDAAADAASSALTSAREQGARAYEGKATSLMAEIELRRGDVRAATRLAEDALAIHRETGHRPGEISTSELLARIADQ